MGCLYVQDVRLSSVCVLKDGDGMCKVRSVGLTVTVRVPVETVTLLNASAVLVDPSSFCG